MAVTHDHNDRDHHTASLVSATSTPALLSRVSWGAIFAGTVIALGVLILLSILGTAIGIQAIDPGTGAPFEGIGIGAGIWWIVTSIVALGIGGFVAARLSGIPDKSSATAHGASVWGLVTILTVWMAASAVGSTINTAAGAFAGAFRVAGSAATTAADAATSPNSPVDISASEIENAAQEAVNTAQRQAQQIDTQELRADAEAAAIRASEGLSTAAWYAFFASLLAFGAAVLGAGAGSPKRTFVTAREEVDLDNRSV